MTIYEAMINSKNQITIFYYLITFKKLADKKIEMEKGEHCKLPWEGKKMETWRLRQPMRRKSINQNTSVTVNQGKEIGWTKKQLAD